MADREKSYSLRRPGWLWALACAAALCHSLAFAGEAGDKKGAEKKADRGGFVASKNEPIYITADQMEADRKKSMITYRGRVVALQGEMTMRSNSLTAYFTADMKELREVVAEGEVHVSQGDRVATGAKAIFNGKDQTITLTGNPVVRQGNSEISGSRITFFIEQERAVVDGGTQRVKATIFPQELERRPEREKTPGKEP